MTSDEEKRIKFKEKYGCTVDHFLEDEYSICREERQYAVFLYNILRYYRKPEKRGAEEIKRIFDACWIPKGAEVIQVFYEATFMRDFFERNRRIVLGEYDEGKLQKPISRSKYVVKEEDSFNFKLLNYVHEKYCKEKSKENGGLKADEPLEYSDKERNLGRNGICTNILPEEKFTVRCMMEAKPDIAVIYKSKQQSYLLFLECKFDSEESYYKSRDSHGIKMCRTQRDIQWKIADFLCEYYLEEKVSDRMKEEKKSCLVKFVRSKSPQSEEISIRDLIEINGRIFGETD